MVVERRHIELLRRGELLHLFSPFSEQSRAFVPDEQRESVEIVDYLLCGRKPVYQGFAPVDEDGARYRVRTCDPYRVKVVLYH